ncbi:hypothetical protein SPKIRA_37110 (plasmid) [Sphingomonas paucimobilis]|uniref:helix-turn-helix domain-containing protein n=1 Tax=Sphingomonas paucimobilis TaxID=13689 RepID=UPI0015DC5616|nr:helix-turn-helix domain-containing protein [Sphingomonas paucimobilis]BCI72881.1 hypothetical protein SPKIRA_37110 [Sphingomonas paucimobilis]
MARTALDAGRRIKREARGQGRALTGPEHALASLTAGAVRVYEELCTLARLNAGRVYPSYDRRPPRPRSAAPPSRARSDLEEAGFLVRQRRFRRVEGEGPGPRWEQTSNAYRPVVPKQLLSLLPRWLRPAPVPDDALQHVAEQAEEQERLKAQLTCRELAQFTVGGALGRVLARLGIAIDRQMPVRESHADPEPLPSLFEKENKASPLPGETPLSGHETT